MTKLIVIVALTIATAVIGLGALLSIASQPACAAAKEYRSGMGGMRSTRKYVRRVAGMRGVTITRRPWAPDFSTTFEDASKTPDATPIKPIPIPTITVPPIRTTLPDAAQASAAGDANGAPVRVVGCS